MYVCMYIYIRLAQSYFYNLIMGSFPPDQLFPSYTISEDYPTSSVFTQHIISHVIISTLISPSYEI